ncbi:MAG: SurA N-terminal domain-containing protein [Gammaproteobacteria bacterium]|nr:SurA N-terminal domain-containing protein [Gammaproteobacteria bacterium]
MLQAIRNNAQGVFVWIIVGLIVISFALFGLGSYLSGASKVVAASVNGVEISSTDLTRAYQNYQERLRNMFGEQYNPEMFATTQVKQEVLQGLITQEVMNQLLHKQGYKASSEQIFEKIKKYEAFQEGGVFSATRYKEVLSQQGMNGEAFENDLSRDIATQQIRSAIGSSAFITEKEKQVLAMLENQKRKIGYFDVSLKPYLKSVNVSDEEVKSYYEKNSHLYLSEEMVQIEYVELNMADVAARQEVTEEQIKQHYETSPESYMYSDDIAAKKKITELRNQIQQGADFASLAKEHSQDKGSAQQGGDLGYLTRGIEEKFDNVVFALKKGEISQVIKSKEGFQIIQVEDIRTGDPEERKVRHILLKAKNKLQPFADVKAAIRKELQYQEAGKVFFNDADQMNNLSYETPDSLAPVADALGLKLNTSTLMTRRGGTGLLANPKILKAAFSNEVLKEGRNSELLEISETHNVVLRVKEHKAASVLAFDKVKSRIKESLLQEKASIKAQEVTSDIFARLNNNESIDSVKKRYPETKWVDTGWIKRKTDKETKISVGLPDQLRQHAFEMPKPVTKKTSWDKVSLPAGNQAVIAVFKVENTNETNTANDNNRITQVLGNTDYNSFVQYQKSQADISVSQAAFEADTNQ